MEGVDRTGPTPQELIRLDLYLDFRASLRAVLATGDLAALRALLREGGAVLGDRDLVLMAGWPAQRLAPRRHHLILADVELKEQHQASRRWLRRHGFRVPQASTGYGRPNAAVPWLARSA